MKLHDNKALFEEIIIRTRSICGIEEEIIIKDYYATMLLKEIIMGAPEAIFKGGTSLSKCYNIINRFSEDIDLSCECNEGRPGRKNIKQFNTKIKEVISNLNLSLVNPEKIKSGHRYNKFIIDYGANKALGIKQEIIIETAMQTEAFPVETRTAETLIYRYLHNELADIMEEYNMQPFEVKVQTLERTFLDKVFALCDYFLTGHIVEHSRHIYDLYQLKPHIALDEKMKALMYEVRKVRKEFDGCVSVRDEHNINELLQKIIDQDIYKDDYENITAHLLYDGVSYEEAIGVIQEIIDSDIMKH